MIDQSVWQRVREGLETEQVRQVVAFFVRPEGMDEFKKRVENRELSPLIVLAVLEALAGGDDSDLMGEDS